MNEIHYPPPLHHHPEAASHPPKILPGTSREEHDTLMSENGKRPKGKIQISDMCDLIKNKFIF